MVTLVAHRPHRSVRDTDTPSECSSQSIKDLQTKAVPVLTVSGMRRWLSHCVYSSCLSLISILRGNLKITRWWKSFLILFYFFILEWWSGYSQGCDWLWKQTPQQPFCSKQDRSSSSFPVLISFHVYLSEHPP